MVVEIAGLPIIISSADANTLNFEFLIFYYPNYSQESIKSGIGTAIESFKLTQQFDQVFYTNSLESYIMDNVQGLRNISLINTSLDGADFENSIELSAGYFNYDGNILDVNNFIWNAV